MYSVAGELPSFSPGGTNSTFELFPDQAVGVGQGVYPRQVTATDGIRGQHCQETIELPFTRNQPMANDWNSLLNNAKNGHHADRNRLFELLRARLLTISQFKLRGWPIEEVEDIVQDTLSVILDKLDTINDNPHYYALAVLENKIGGVLRQRKRRTMISLNPTGSQSEQEVSKSEIQLPSDSHDEMLDGLHGSEIAEKLVLALKKLSPLCQAIFIALLQLRSVADVWDVYQEREPKLNRNAFDKRLFDCRRKLRDITAGQLA